MQQHEFETPEPIELVVEIGKRWLATPDRNTQALVKRAFRTLIKVGDAGALAAMGFSGDAGVTGPLLDQRSVRVGEDIEVRAILTNTGSAPTRLTVDYVVNYRKGRGQTAPKVFKMAKSRLRRRPDATISCPSTARPSTASTAASTWGVRSMRA